MVFCTNESSAEAVGLLPLLLRSSSTGVGNPNLFPFSGEKRKFDSCKFLKQFMSFTFFL